MTAPIDFAESAKHYTLSIRLSTDGFSFSVCGSSGDGGEVAGGFFIRRSMQETCLEMYTSRMWEEELDKIQRLNPYVREHRDFIRRFMAGVRFVEADAVGRVNIPADLAAWAHFEREVVLSSTVSNSTSTPESAASF